MKEVKSVRTDFESEILYRIGKVSGRNMNILFNIFNSDTEEYDAVDWIDRNYEFIHRVISVTEVKNAN
jgi:hypothetical protein